MAGSSDSDDRGRRRSLADLYGDDQEEREYRSDEEAEDGHNIHGDATGNSARANNGDARARPSSSVAASKNGDGSPYPAMDPVLACDMCGEEFRSREAVCDHIKVHQEAEQGIGCDAPDHPSWGVTREREWPGASRDASPSSAQESNQFIGAVAAFHPKIDLEPMPLSSATPNPSSATATDYDNNALETEVMAGVANPQGDVVRLLQAAPPSPPAAGNPASSAPVQQQPAAAAPPPSPRGGRYQCYKCDKWFPTRQALGGHVAAHFKKRAAGLQDGAGPQKVYVCRVCGEEYPTGPKLGGHMRKHYTGPPIVVKKKPGLALAIPQPLPPPGTATAAPAPSVKAEEASSAPSPATAGSLLGIDIKEAEAEQTPPAAQQGSSVTETEAASPDDTGTGEEQ